MTGVAAVVVGSGRQRLGRMFLDPVLHLWRYTQCWQSLLLAWVANAGFPRADLWEAGLYADLGPTLDWHCREGAQHAEGCFAEEEWVG